MELFEYIEKELRENDIVDLHTWGDETRTKFFHEMGKFYDSKSPIVKYEDVNYLISYEGAISGSGGMDEGSPETFTIKKIDEIIDITKSMQRPHPVENPDFAPLIKQLEENMNGIVKDNYADDDDDHYAWETAMQCVYGKDIFNWYNENVT
jgi:hypothetical protein